MIRVDTGVCENLYFHQMTATAAGDVVPTHEHNYPHVLQVQCGAVRVWAGGKDTEILKRGQLKSIPAGVAHDLEFLEAGTVACCIHELRDAQGIVYPFSYKLTTREQADATGRC